MSTVVVGAGIGGIASAFLARRRGEEVTLLESHSKLGGCASYFKRGDFNFDAGATTVSGLGPTGPLGKLLRIIGHSPQFIAADPGMVIHLTTGEKLFYYRNFERWMAELERVFPNLHHRKFWRQVYKLSEWGWSALDRPFQVKNVRLLPHLLVSTELVLKHYGLFHPLYLELVDGILLISAQAPSAQIPFFVGAMALAYPTQAHTTVGGMKGLMNFFEEELLRANVKVLKKSKVVTLSQGLVRTESGEEVKAQKIILNLPIWNVSKLLGSATPRLKGSWGAITVYLGVKSSVQELYQQVHLNNEHVPNYFISFSAPEDRLRSPEGWQSVTISTHVSAVDWRNLSSLDYEEKKTFYQDLILDDFLKRFNITETKFISSATPKTFEDYTGRESGFVGGLPFLYGKNPFRLPFGGTVNKNVWMVGDTVFPGQGLVGVVAGALFLDQRISFTSES